ncbi:MAG: LysR family transcriptional regulator [Oscillospiraceae bacterium]|nr:LysR family transcriptional regulator [Oscillospiraceae bacterium]
MEIQQLKYFIVLCNDRNFEKSAEKLFISPQALRKSIKKLEYEIETPLFYKKGNHLLLTPAGECVRSYSHIIIDNILQLEDHLNDFREDNSYSEITVAIANGVYQRIALSVIESYKQKHPNVGIHLVEMPDIICENYIRRGISDFGFCFGPNDPNIFDIYTIEKYPLCALVNKANHLANRSYLTCRDLKGELIGIADERYKIYFNFTSACKKCGFDPIIDFKGADPFSTHRYSHFTQNITITVDDLSELLMEDNQIRIPIHEETLFSELNILVKKGISLDKNTWKFIEYCTQICGGKHK